MNTQTKDNYRMLLAAIVSGKARWEPFSGQQRQGEVCVGGLRFATALDGKGCPILNESIRLALVRPTRWEAANA